MNNQTQFSGYTLQPQKQVKDHSIVVMVIGIVLSLIVGFVGVILLFVSAMMGLAADVAKDYDEVTAQIVSSERKWSSVDDEYETEYEIVYYDKNGVEYHGTVSSSQAQSGTITIYCDPDNYSKMVYISDPEAFPVVTNVLRIVSFAVLGFAAVMLAASIIIGVVMKKKYKKRLAEAASSFGQNMPQNNQEQN